MDSNEQLNIAPVLLLVLFGLFLSWLGFNVVITLTLGHLHHITSIVMIFYYWDKIEFYRHPGKPVLFMNILRRFYEFTFSLFVALLLFYISSFCVYLETLHTHPVILIPVAFIVFIVFDALYLYKWEQYSTDNWVFDSALKNDTEGIYRREWNTWFKDPDFRENILEDARRGGILPSPKKRWIQRIF